MLTLSIGTFNVNSIKARLPNLLVWLRENPTDIVLLQELKCVDEAFPAMELEELGYNLAIHGQKTYNGVAICSKFPIDDVIRGLPPLPSPAGGGSNPLADSGGWPEVGALQPATLSTSLGDVDPPPAGDDVQARYIEAVISLPGSAMRVASAYVPNGQDMASEKFPYKLRFFERLKLHWEATLKYNEVAVLGGDFNCAPLPIDTWDPARQDGAICYHPAERERLRALLNLGMYDAFRVLHPDVKQYSWWDYRGGGYERSQGMRIDHLLLSGMAVDKLTECHIDESPRQAERPSDHAPVVCRLTF